MALPFPVSTAIKNGTGESSGLVAEALAVWPANSARGPEAQNSCTPDITAAFARVVSAGLIHEDLAHETCGQREQVCTIPQVNAIEVHEPQVGFVDERRRLKKVAGAFRAEVRVRDAAQLVIHQRYDAIQCVRIALLPSPNELSGVLRPWMVGH